MTPAQLNKTKLKDRAMKDLTRTVLIIILFRVVPFSVAASLVLLFIIFGIGLPVDAKVIL